MHGFINFAASITLHSSFFGRETEETSFSDTAMLAVLPVPTTNPGGISLRRCPMRSNAKCPAIGHFYKFLLRALIIFRWFIDFLASGRGWRDYR